MPGTKEGGYKTRETIREKYGDEFYKTVGKLGGATKTKTPKGFAAMTPEQRSEAGRTGGSIGGLKTEAERNEARTRARLAQGKA